MADQAVHALPRIAFVYGDPALAEHVRQAVAGCVEIAYAAPVEGFDGTRMAEAGVTAALVNVDNADALDDIHARFDAAGVPMVFNDPDFSRQLEGWDRARWLRHLVAKLCGSADFDPPRPASSQEGAGAGAATPTAEACAAAARSDAYRDPATNERVVAAAPAAERPLPVHAIETMAGDFESAPADDFLDVDTEALSAMIDAHLNQTGSSTDAAEREAWAIAETTHAPASAAQGPPGGEPPADLPDDRVPGAGSSDATTIAGDPGADLQDVMPALDDWQLLDPDAVSVPVGTTPEPAAAEPALSDAFADLKLVPMDIAAPVKRQADPIERWLDDSEVQPKTRPRAKTTARRNGDKA